MGNVCLEVIGLDFVNFSKRNVVIPRFKLTKKGISFVSELRDESQTQPELFPSLRPRMIGYNYLSKYND